MMKGSFRWENQPSNQEFGDFLIGAYAALRSLKPIRASGSRNSSLPRSRPRSSAGRRCRVLPLPRPRDEAAGTVEETEAEADVWHVDGVAVVEGWAAAQQARTFPHVQRAYLSSAEYSWLGLGTWVEWTTRPRLTN